MVRNLKAEIGKTIRNIRIQKNLTQEDICNDESELTIRQLARIENGHAMITIPKLIFISKTLGVSIQNLVDIEQMTLPKRYLELKNKLIKSHTYGDPERIKKQELIFEEIYNDYYDNLPEDEQLLIEMLQIRTDVWISKNSGFALGLFEEYLHQVLKKQQYSYNDLLLINLYFFCCAIGLEDDSYFDELAKKMVLYNDYSDSEKMYLFERNLLAILANSAPESYLFYTSIFREVIKETNNFQHKPVIYAFEARYYLQVAKDYDKCKDFYRKAIAFAEMQGDHVLVSNLKKERDIDLAT